MRASAQSSARVAGVERWLLRPVDGTWLAAFRIWFGLALSISMLRFSVHDWIEPLFVAPQMQLRYWGFSWVEPLSRAQMHALFWVLAALALASALGLFYRFTAFAFAVGLTYVHLLDVTIYLNHYYLACLLAFLLSVSPAHRVWSLDAWRRRRVRARRAGLGAAAPSSTVCAAWLYLFRLQVGVVYVFAGLAKAQSDWLVHAQPLRIWLGANTDLPILGPLFTWDGVPLLMSWFGFLFDTTIVLWLLLPKTRPWAYAVVVGFHVLTRMLFPIGMFPAIMIGSALVFFDPHWPRRLIERLSRLISRGASSQHAGAPQTGSQRVTPATAGRAGAPSAWQRAGLVVGALYGVVQLLLPLRHLAYGDNVLWHEQGMRFSWRVMVRAKGGGATFHVRNRRTGEAWHVQPSAYLTPMQESEMVTQPDLILRLAHHIRDDFARRGRGPVEVRVESSVTLNGRRAEPLIDPTVDLASIEDGLTRASWILPAPKQPPPHTRPVL